MRHLFNALKEHWQIYLGLFLGLVIGLLVGVGFADWKSLVKGFDSKVTDWISSLSTLFGIVIAIVGFNSWRTQKYFDLEIKYLETLKTIEKKVLELRTDLRLTDIDELYKICNRHINQMIALHIELEINSLIVQKNKDKDLNDLLKKHELLYSKLVGVIAYSQLSNSIISKDKQDIEDKISKDKQDIEDKISKDKQDIDDKIQAVHDKVDNLVNNFKFS
jgi:hypothetical protein